MTRRTCHKHSVVSEIWYYWIGGLSLHPCGLPDVAESISQVPHPPLGNHSGSTAGQALIIRGAGYPVFGQTTLRL